METYRAAPQSSRSIIFIGVSTAVVLFFLWAILRPTGGPTVYKAVAVLSGDSPVTGTVSFEQASKTGPVTITGQLENMDPLAKRGFHIHQLGDATNGCLSAGSHFNPFNKNHGGPSDTERHVGDLGNIDTDRSGVAKFSIEDKQITLNGPLSVIGRTVVVHSGVDDLGQGGNAESLKTGNAGARSACGVIGISELS